MHPLTTGSGSGAGSGGGGAGALQVIRLAIGFANPTYTSVTTIPANAVVLRAFLDIEVAFANGESPPPTIELGTAGNASAFMATTDSTPTQPGLFDAPQDTPVTSASKLVATIGNAPNVGAGFACVEFSVPLP